MHKVLTPTYWAVIKGPCIKIVTWGWKNILFDAQLESNQARWKNTQNMKFSEDGFPISISLQFELLSILNTSRYQDRLSYSPNSSVLNFTVASNKVHYELPIINTWLLLAQYFSNYLNKIELISLFPRTGTLPKIKLIHVVERFYACFMNYRGQNRSHPATAYNGWVGVPYAWLQMELGNRNTLVSRWLQKEFFFPIDYWTKFIHLHTESL